MKKEKIYIAGKVTGDPCYKMKFNAGVERLVELGWEQEQIVNETGADGRRRIVVGGEESSLRHLFLGQVALDSFGDGKHG